MEIKNLLNLALAFRKPKRFGSRGTMTVAILEHNYRVSNSKGRIDIVKIVQMLRKAEQLLVKATNDFKSGK
jgi:hypothetical protein